MRDRHDPETLRRVTIKDMVRKRSDKRAAKLGTEWCASIGEVSGELNCLSDSRCECCSQAGAFAVIPPNCFNEINLRFGMERSRKRHAG